MWKPEPAMAVAEENRLQDDIQKTLFKKTFSSTEHGPTETIMEQKHLCAMEEFGE
jgi:D-tyrosyl-tRNA(Tyr) deacylase